MKTHIKLFLVIMLVILSSLVLIPDSSVSDAQQDPEATYTTPTLLNYSYVWNRTKNLTEIIKVEKYNLYGRYFGTSGEREAARRIQDWMDLLNLSNVHNETINRKWKCKDSYAKLLSFPPFKNDLYIGALDERRTKQKLYLNISVYKKNPYTLKHWKNFTFEPNSEDICFPIWIAPLTNKIKKYTEINDAVVIEDFDKSLDENQVILAWENWANPYHSFGNEVNHRKIIFKDYYKGFILIDDFRHTRFFTPCHKDHLAIFAAYPRAGFSINRSQGFNITDYVNKSSSYNVNASFKSVWHYENVTSKNVIGQINGAGPEKDKVVIIGAHYDSVPSQGAVDEALETALVLAIAEYIQNHNLSPRYTLKFVAFGGEEVGMRGAKDYYLKHVKDEGETVKYVINPGNFGHNDRFYFNQAGVKKNITFNASSKNNCLRKLACDIGNVIGYEDVTDIQMVSEKRLPAEDSKVFGEKDETIGVLQFGRSPKKGYHRDGLNHTEGDVLVSFGEFSGIHNFSASMECDVVLLTTLMLCFKDQLQFDAVDFSCFDVGTDDDNDSVQIAFMVSNQFPTIAKLQAGLYDSDENLVSTNEINEYVYLDYKKNYSSWVNLTLQPNQSYSQYKARVKILNYWGELRHQGNAEVNLFPSDNPAAMFDVIDDAGGSKTIHFVDMSQAPMGASLVNWSWMWGDGSSSYFTDVNYTSKHFNHTYEKYGNYTVRLTVTDNTSKTDFTSKEINVKEEAPVASFAVSPDVALVGQTVYLNSTSTDGDGSINCAMWDFGDGSERGSECMMDNVTHSFDESGWYTVELEVTDDNLTDVCRLRYLVVDALVDDDFTDNASEHEWNSISEGISDIPDDGYLYVFNGTYHEAVFVNKSVGLYGKSKSGVVVDASSLTFDTKLFSVVNDSVVVDGFSFVAGMYGVVFDSVNDSVVRNCSFVNCTYGVYLGKTSSGNVIQHCVFEGNLYGLYLNDSSDNFVGFNPMVEFDPMDCRFTLNNYSIVLNYADYNSFVGCYINATPSSDESTYGVVLRNSDNNSWCYCEVFNASVNGFLVNDSCENEFTSNIIRENQEGVLFENASDNYVYQNNFSRNVDEAVKIMLVSSSGNYISFNDFVDNGVVQGVQVLDNGSSNYWNESGNETCFYFGASSEGNFWSDYNGADSDGDGLGDSVYNVSGSANAFDGAPAMELYGFWISWANDTGPPVISNVSVSPDLVGFGGDVTVSAVVVDGYTGVNYVKVNVSFPDNSSELFNMIFDGNDTYQVVFSKTWLAGQYNYTILTIDNANNSANSSGHSFNVSAQATINVVTLKDSYMGGEFINITDPPSPPESWCLTGRGLTWNEFYDAEAGNNVLELFTHPVNYQDGGVWQPINTSLTALDSEHPAYQYGYRSGNERGLYNVYFKLNADLSWPVAFAYNKSTDSSTDVVRTELMGVGYVDPTEGWSYEYLQSVQNSSAVVDNYQIMYSDVFNGTDLRFRYGNTGLKEEIILDADARDMISAHPPSNYGLNDSGSYLVFITRLDYQNLVLFNDSGLLEDNVTITQGGVDFKDALGRLKCALPLGVAFEENNPHNMVNLTYRILQYNGNCYLLSGLPVSTLTSMSFPVVIDPSLTIYSSVNDGHIVKSGTMYNAARNAPTGTVADSINTFTVGQDNTGQGSKPYYIWRGFLMFNTSTVPSNVIIENTTLMLYVSSDDSTTDFDITMQDGQPTYPHKPLESGDYDKDHYSGDGGSLDTSDLVSGYNNITLNMSWMNLTGWTKLCLRSSRDIGGSSPGGDEHVTFWAIESPGIGDEPKLVLVYRNQSKIKNTGDTNISGYLQMRVDYLDTTQQYPGTWNVDTIVVNDTTPRTINSSDQLALDSVFNGLVNTNDFSNGNGTYRVYAAFRDPDGDVLVCDDETELAAWYEFEVTFS